MGSSRRFGTTADLKLQKILRQQDSRFDASQMLSPTTVDHSTRFDAERIKDERMRKELDDKREVCYEFKTSNNIKNDFSLFRVEQIVGKKQLNK